MQPEGISTDMAEAEYRAAEGVSQSLLKDFGRAATPKHFKAAKPKEATADMEFGTVCHAAVLTPDKFRESYWKRPETYEVEVRGKWVEKPWHGGADYCKEWLAGHSDRPVMSEEQIQRVHKIKARLLEIEIFAETLKHGQTEVACFKRDEQTGLMLKARCDLMATDVNETTWIFDLKKVQSGCATEKEFANSCMDYGYHIQAASYLNITGASRFVFVPFDDNEPFDACLWEPDAEMLAKGYEQWRSLLNRYATCLKTDTFPGYVQGLNRLSLPAWARKNEV